MPTEYMALFAIEFHLTKVIIKWELSFILMFAHNWPIAHIK